MQYILRWGKGGAEGNWQTLSLRAAVQVSVFVSITNEEKTVVLKIRREIKLFISFLELLSYCDLTKKNVQRVSGNCDTTYACKYSDSE